MTTTVQTMLDNVAEHLVYNILGFCEGSHKNRIFSDIESKVCLIIRNYEIG